MKLNYTDTEECPISIDITLGELRTLVKITKGADTPVGRRIHEELVGIYCKSIESGSRRFKFDRNLHDADLGIKTDEDA